MCIRVSACRQLYIYVYICTCMCIQLYMYVYACVYNYTCMCISFVLSVCMCYSVSPQDKGGGVHQWYMTFGQQCSICVLF